MHQQVSDTIGLSLCAVSYFNTLSTRENNHFRNDKGSRDIQLHVFTTLLYSCTLISYFCTQIVLQRPYRNYSTGFNALQKICSGECLSHALS